MRSRLMKEEARAWSGKAARPRAPAALPNAGQGGSCPLRVRAENPRLAGLRSVWSSFHLCGPDAAGICPLFPEQPVAVLLPHGSLPRTASSHQQTFQAALRCVCTREITLRLWQWMSTKPWVAHQGLGETWLPPRLLATMRSAGERSRCPPLPSYNWCECLEWASASTHGHRDTQILTWNSRP